MISGVAVYHLARSPIQNQRQSPWAVKKLIKKQAENKEISGRLKIEADILKNLKHENIVGFRAFNEKLNILAMEECSKGLGDIIEELFFEEDICPFSPKLINKVAKDIAAALNYLHNEALVLHCDIKSYNVLIKGDFEICKLCDFGVALPLNKSGEVDTTKVDEDVEYAGSIPWCAPEILSFPQIITTKADIYAYGLLIWEMIALMPPALDESILKQLDSSLNYDTSVLVDKCVPRKRPALPEDVELGAEYNHLLELFYLCTHEEMDKRPTAKDLFKVTS